MYCLNLFIKYFYYYGVEDDLISNNHKLDNLVITNQPIKILGLKEKMNRD